MVPTDMKLLDWKRLAEETTFTSALGEYTPPEFLVLLVELQRLKEVLREVVEGFWFDPVSNRWWSNLPEQTVNKVLNVVAEEYQ